MKLALLIIILSLTAIAQAPPQLPDVSVELCKPAVVQSNELSPAIESIKAQGCEVQVKSIDEYWLVYGVRVEIK